MFSKDFAMAAVRIGISCIVALLFSCLPSSAANFDIYPVRVELNAKNRLAKLSIRNVSQTGFPVQVRAYEWTQNEKGEDVYRETQDIIVFPKIMTIAPNEERFIRLGSNVAPGANEKTYRIYIEEMPAASAAAEGANIRLYMKVGVPVFIAPIKTEDKVDIEQIAVSEGTFRLKVKNTGNTHFIVTGINLRGLDADGLEPFTREIGGWYLLSGTEKVYETQIPPDPCTALTRLAIELKTSRTTINKELPLEPAMCAAPTNSAASR